MLFQWYRPVCKQNQCMRHKRNHDIHAFWSSNTLLRMQSCSASDGWAHILFTFHAHKQPGIPLLHSQHPQVHHIHILVVLQISWDSHQQMHCLQTTQEPNNLVTNIESCIHPNPIDANRPTIHTMAVREHLTTELCKKKNQFALINGQWKEWSGH